MSYNYVPDDMLLYYLFWKKVPGYGKNQPGTNTFFRRIVRM